MLVSCWATVGDAGFFFICEFIIWIGLPSPFSSNFWSQRALTTSMENHSFCHALNLWRWTKYTVMLHWKIRISRHIKHDTFQCWYHVEPPSATLARHEANIGSVTCLLQRFDQQVNRISLGMTDNHVDLLAIWQLKRHNQAKIIRDRYFYFGFLIWPYYVNLSID